MAEELNNLDADLTADALADAIGEPDLVNDPVETPELSERELELERSKEIASEISVNSDLNASDQFLIGNDIKFSAKQQNVEKYLTYDKDTVYGKLGFNPFLDSVLQEDGTYKSGMDHLYDENTTASDDLWRAYDGMLKLATIGFQDTFALGAFHDDDNYIDFEDVMSKYSSSKGGSVGFWSNTMLSSGYTAGIITGIAAEELALTLVTGGLGAIGGAGNIAKTGAFRFLSKGKKQGKFVDAAEELSDINKATTWLGRRKQAFGRGAKNFGRAINPIGETMDFVRNIDRVKDFNGLKATALGAASVVRDMRKIYMAHSESQLEADMAEKDFREKNYDDYYIDYVNLDKNGNPTMKNVGTNRSDEWAANMDREAKRVHDNVYAGNFGLIYLTNAVTFDNMFKHMKGTGRMFGYSASGAYKVVRNAATKKVTVNALKKQAGQYVRNKVAGWTLLGTAKSGIKSVATSSMEGVQELGQDILSESFKDYHSRNVQGTQAKGGLMHYLQNDLAHAIKKQNSSEGLETFLSGMFMGVFASPVGFATGQINTFINGGGFISAQGTYNKIFNKEKYKKEQEAEMAKLEKEAEFLTKFFNENKNFLESWSKPIARQAELQEEMLEAAQKGHKEKFKSAQNESFTNGLKRVIKAGLSGQMIDNLNYMATELNAEELSQLMARTDITEENIGEFRKKLLDNAELLENLDLKFKSIQENFVNPTTLSELDPKSDNYIDQYIEYVAFESLKDELLFSHSKIVDRAKRLKEIKEIIKNENPLSQEFSVESLVDLNSLNSTIQTLQAEVEANKTMNLTGSELFDAKLTERRLKALEAYKVVLAQTEELLYNANSSESEAEVYEEMLDVYQEVVKAFGKQRLTNEAAQREIDSKAFDLIFDYIVLEKQEGEYTKYAETLMTDSGASEFVDSQKLMLERLEKNKKAHIKNALIEFNKKKLSNEMLSALYDAGVFFDLQYLDDLLNNRVSPEEFINLENNEPATAEQTRAALKILDRYIKKLTGKPIIKSGIKKGSQGRKLKQDKRTVKGILRQYGIKLDTNINLSSKAGLKLLNRLMQNDNKYLTELDREILMKVIEQEATIRFVDDQSLPIQINEAGVITIDVRFAGEDYVNSPYSIENLITTALTQNKILEDLVENDNLWLQARDAMRQAKQQYARLYPKEDVDNMPVFNSVDVFLSEALNDAGFQYLLSQIEDKVQPTKKSLWSTIKQGSEAIIEEKFENKLVNRVINIAAKAVDDTIVDNISEINRTLRTDEAQEALDKRTEELKVMGARLGLQWNVNVKILKDQQEALEYLDKIKNPFYSKEEGVPAGFYDEKTNTAYIVAENAKANTPYHEIFLHPFLINAEKKNPELYKSLIAEAKADQTVVDYVEKNYGKEETIGSRQFEHELVGRVYELAMANEINEKEKPGLFKRIYEFAKLMIKETAKFLKILPRDVSKFKPNKTTIKDLAKYSTKQEGINLGAIIEGTEDVTPKVEKVKVKKTVTREIQENVGGNTVVMNEARDQPSLMEDFINDDIQLENAESVNAATDEIVALGKELDEIDVLADESNWKFGDLRVEIDGRLIIDVIANGKRFLMYKSTGTGTTADTAGEWTPLLYFGTKLKKDGSGRNEWFVKALFEGQDPKKNKYGSKTFIGLDSLLKAQESELFLGREEIRTRTETEEIEVEEEVVKEKVVDEDLNTSIGVQNKIDNINSQINTAKENLEKGKGTFIEKRRLSNKIAKLQIQANELYAKKKELLKEEEKKEGPILESDPEYVPEYDTNKNEIITPEMPFARMPKVLQITLAKLYGKPLTALEQKDIEVIAELRETNPEYIAAVNKYSKERFEREEQSLNEKEVKLNQEKIDKAKAKRQAELAAQRKDKKGKKVKLSLEEKIKQLPGAEVLSEDEVTDLANQIKNQQGVFPFGFQEIRNIITEKKRAEELSRPRIAANMTAEELKALEEQQKRWDEQAKQSRKKKEQIEQNIKRLGKSGSYNAFLYKKLDEEGKKVFKRNEINIPNGMRQFILKYHPEIFSLDEEAFNVRINNIMRNYRNMRSSIIPANFKFKSTDPLEILKEVKTLMNKLDAEKNLYPSVVVQINRALNESGVTYTIKRLGSKQLKNSASMYDLKFTPQKRFGDSAILPERMPGTSPSAILKNADIEDIRFKAETQGAIALADILLTPNVRLSREFFLTLDSPGTKQGQYDAWISEDKNKQLTGIGNSRIISTSGLGELIEQNLSSLLNISVEEVQKALGFGMVPGQSLVEDLMADTFTRDELRQRVADMITDDYQAAKDQELDLMPEELVSLMEYAEWSTTKEGKKIIEEEMASKAQDTELYEEMFIEETLARERQEEQDEEELSLPEVYFGKTVIAEELNKTIKVNEQLKIIWGALTNEKQNDLNYVKAVARLYQRTIRNDSKTKSS